MIVSALYGNVSAIVDVERELRQRGVGERGVTATKGGVASDKREVGVRQRKE